MSLNEIWFILFVVIIVGYLILDGFDIGVGILHIPVADGDEERRTTLNSIGPIWDGNEVWLVLGGGGPFAAFPIVYVCCFRILCRHDVGTVVPHFADGSDRIPKQARG